jgi:hypothetical protein
VVTGAFPETVTGVDMQAEGTSFMFTPPGMEVALHWMVTVPVKPFTGVIVRVEVAVAPAVTTTEVLLSLTAGGAFTVTATLVMAMIVPFVSGIATNIWYCPGVVPDCVWIVTVVVTGAFPEIVSGGMDEQVGALFMLAPPGTMEPSHSRVTVPEKPFVGVTVMVEVPLAPGKAIVTGVPVRVMPGGTTVRGASAEVLPL